MVCRTRRADTELVRAGQASDGSWYVGRGPGRGVWWCADTGCGEVVQVGNVARALRKAVSAGDMDALTAELKAHGMGSVVKE